MSTNGKYLYQKVYDDVFSKIVSGVYEAGVMLPSEKELCASLDVSLITVRRALEELEKDELVRKVKGKGTFVNEHVKQVSHGPKNKNIGILDIAFEKQVHSRYEKKYNYKNYWKNKIYNSMFMELASEYNIIYDGYQKDVFMKDFENTAFTGVDRILLIGENSQEIIDFLQAKGKLVVVYNNFDKDRHVCSVSNNERGICRKAVEHLIEHGHSYIGVINGMIEYSESIERYMGFQEALVHNDIMLRTDFVKWGDMTPESGYYLMKEMLAAPKLPSAVFCVNDGVAMGAMDAIKEAGLRCPDDISLIAHDNNAICEKLNPKLTSINPRYDLIGEKIAQLMKSDIWVEDSMIVESQLVLRDSVRFKTDSKDDKRLRVNE